MGKAGWTILICFSCLLIIAVDSAILRDWRYKAKMNITALKPRPRPTHPGKIRRVFRPTENGCCKIGEKVAKRRYSCDVRLLGVMRRFDDLQRAKMKYNRPRKMSLSAISTKLYTKVRKCSARTDSDENKFYDKCCKYKTKFYISMAKCRERKGKERRKCRQSLRASYKTPTSESRRHRKQREPRRSRRRGLSK